MTCVCCACLRCLLHYACVLYHLRLQMAQHLDSLATELESSAYPALDALAHTASSNNLERVRRLKSSLVRLTTRVETLRDVS